MRANPQVIAKSLAQDILANPGKYMLRYRCLLKLTSRMLWLAITSYGDASYASVLRALIKILERNGYVLVEVYRSRSRKVYYFKPPESVCRAVGESKAKVSQAVVTDTA